MPQPIRGWGGHVGIFSEKQHYFLKIQWKIYGKSTDFTYGSYGERVDKILADQISGQSSRMLNRFKKKQHFFMTIRGKIVVSLVTGHVYGHSEEEVEYVKSLRHGWID